jgi:predicted NAD-dependent protein-ADP-ribosyltransferase YbiA (DUF1768 family)
MPRIRDNTPGNRSYKHTLHDLGPQPQACRQPINVTSESGDESIRLISNLAHTPFQLDGKPYASVEGFWQGLKFSGEGDRGRIAQLYGLEAKEAGYHVPYPEHLAYQGAIIRTGTYEHWSLMRQACWAKFTRHVGARQSLLSTGSRPLTHRTRADSKTIPGVIMAGIWMTIRSRLSRNNSPAANET